MAKKYKLTGFARFFVVMLFLVPAAYIGASYYNGEDGIQNIRQLIGLDKASEKVQSEEVRIVESDLPSDVKTLQQELTDLRRRIDAMERENKELKDQIFIKNEEIVELQRQLKEQ